MADGNSGLTPAPPRAGAKLGEALAGRATLWARCGCGRQAVLDPASWLAQGLARQPLASLETRLRCICGAREARLEIRGLCEAPRGERGEIFIFR